MTFSTPADYAADEALSAAKLNRDLYNNMTWLYSHYPQRALLHHVQSTVTSGNAITGTVDTSQQFMTYFYQNPAAVNDQFTHTVRLGPGVYQVKFTGQQYANGGFFNIDMDGQSVGDYFDTYSAATVRNVDLLGGNGYIEVIQSKVYTITVTVYYKNPASGGYGLRLTSMEFIPNAGDL